MICNQYDDMLRNALSHLKAHVVKVVIQMNVVRLATAPLMSLQIHLMHSSVKKVRNAAQNHHNMKNVQNHVTQLEPVVKLLF